MNLPYTIVLPTAYGQMLVNRHDINQTGALLKTGKALDFHEISFIAKICDNAPQAAVALDIGANFGTFALACGHTLAPKGGVVHAFEAQRVIAYMLCGSVALNSLENVFVHTACVGNGHEDIDVPRFNYHQTLNFGSIEFGKQQTERLNQERGASIEKVQQIRIDDKNFTNVCFIKIDVEGMEFNVLQGAQETIERERPVALVEYIKSDRAQLGNFFLQRGYKVWVWGGNLLCIHEAQASVYKIDLPVL